MLVLFVFFLAFIHALPPGGVHEICANYRGYSGTFSTNPNSGELYLPQRVAEKLVSQGHATWGACPDSECSSDRLVCGNRCVDPNTNKFNCGRCGDRCHPLDVCVEGECYGICDQSNPERQAFCDELKCPRGTVRVNDECITPPPNSFAPCDGGNKPFVDLMNDNDHCGACGYSCGDRVCVEGRCVVLN